MGFRPILTKGKKRKGKKTRIRRADFEIIGYDHTIGKKIGRRHESDSKKGPINGRIRSPVLTSSMTSSAQEPKKTMLDLILVRRSPPRVM
jgi:hypothetical protein